MSKTTSQKIKRDSEQETLRKIINLRPNPLKSKRLSRNTPFKISLETTDKPLGRVALATFVYRTRMDVLDLSGESFCKLCIEDFRRSLLLKGASPAEVDNMNISLATMTLNRIETCEGEGFFRIPTLNIISSRILNPDTGDAFTTIELQELYQDLKQTMTKDYIKYIWSDEYRENSSDLQSEINYKLAYTLSPVDILS